jgi:TPR repeat protein
MEAIRRNTCSRFATLLSSASPVCAASAAWTACPSIATSTAIAACLALAAAFPSFASAQESVGRMPALDLQFDAKNAAEIPRLMKLIGDRSGAEAALARAKKRDKAAQAELRKKTEEARNALADLAVSYVAQMEMAEALGRLEFGQLLVERYKKDFPHTLWRLDQRSKAGDGRASSTLGTLYRLGIVAERSEEKACDYYRRAAQTGQVSGLFRAASCIDPVSEAARVMRVRAAEGGHPLAQEMRGRECLGEKPDANCALHWLGRAAAQGRAGAMSLLGFVYSTGEVVPRDDARAFAYLLDAARLGEAAAQNNVGQLYELGRGVPASAAEAFAWYQRAAEAGLGRAQVNLARAYIEGLGTTPDRAAATLWLERAQTQGVAEATKLLAWLAAR